MIALIDLQYCIMHMNRLNYAKSKYGFTKGLIQLQKYCNMVEANICYYLRYRHILSKKSSIKNLNIFLR